MPHPDWNESYETGDAPWDTGEPDNHLVEFVRSGAVPPGRALDVGCGTGTNARWLAEHGFKVLGIDIASVAIEQARTKTTQVKSDCRFETLDFLDGAVRGGPFDFIFDRGCFHVFDQHEEREKFASRVAALLTPDGRWLSLIGSTEGGEREFGPPRRTARDVVMAIEPALEILDLHSVNLQARLPFPIVFWLCVCRPRQLPAVLSSRRD